MSKSGKTRDQLIADLRERAKELNCLYEVEKILSQAVPPERVFEQVTKVIGPGWQYPDVCEAKIEIEGGEYRSSEFEETPWVIEADIEVQEEKAGSIAVYYTEERPPADEGPFLKEEVRLLRTIADRLGHYILFRRMQELQRTWKEAGEGRTPESRAEWRVALELMRDTDHNLYERMARKMLNHLCAIGVPEAREMLQQVDPGTDAETQLSGEVNVPEELGEVDRQILISGAPFDVAAAHLASEEILERVQRWIQEDKVSFFIRVLDNPRSSLPEIADALRRYQHAVGDQTSLSPSILQSMRVSLTERFLTGQLEFIKSAKEYVRINNFYDLLDRIIMPADSHGKLGGKGAGLLLSHWVLEQIGKQETDLPVGEVRVPKTWYVASDGILEFISHNDLEDVINQKFKEIDEVRREYPNIVQLFKSSPFPPELVHGISAALDDFGDSPIIVRSSSLLEDRLGTAFSGKYKSLFLANQGSKQERLQQLLDAIAEIYASVFGPDPIEYRRERGLLEFNEQMGLLIQEVVGTRVGRYFLPAFGGVAFSQNEFRWSPRIAREDGLVRLVPGLGTRAVDRTSDDYPVLIAPGKPNLRVNVVTDEVLRYAPRKLDVINLETNTLETVDLKTVLEECGSRFPGLAQVFSVYSGDMLKKPVGLMVNVERDELVPTFEGLRTDARFLARMVNILRLLEERFKTPVDIEFAHDGTDFYILQCRPQSQAGEAAPAPIPKDVPKSDVLFSANRYVSNGWIPDITHVVYVDPESYGKLGSRAELLSVGRAVGRLNKLLPKRQFVLIGPGRWGSRGDIKLGVSVTYADISNTAMLIEVARRSGNYVPDLSFGTHFFQDLVESRIRYLPLYPDEDGNRFNEGFLKRSPNLLPQMLPDYAHLSDTIRVIDVPAVAQGRVLRVLLNADLDEALGLISSPQDAPSIRTDSDAGSLYQPVQYWRWRYQMAERIAAEMDAERLGVVGLYLIGSVKNATAGPGSDIDLLVHFRGSEKQRCELLAWLDGWSRCLAEVNYMRSGYRVDGLVDVHLVTDEDIDRKTSYAVKIGAVTDAARPLAVGKKAAGTS
jgi:pyruvate,water dikinase